MNIDGLRELGANVDEGLERCMGMEDFYVVYYSFSNCPDTSCHSKK